jgi:hypothetical protein
MMNAFPKNYTLSTITKYILEKHPQVCQIKQNTMSTQRYVQTSVKVTLRFSTSM